MRDGIIENYNNSKKRNDMRVQLDKMATAEKRFIALTSEELDTMLAIAINGSSNLDTAKDRKLAEGRGIELKHLFDMHLY